MVKGLHVLNTLFNMQYSKVLIFPCSSKSNWGIRTELEWELESENRITGELETRTVELELENSGN